MLMYFFIRLDGRMVAKPVKCQVNCSNEFSHIVQDRMYSSTPVLPKPLPEIDINNNRLGGCHLSEPLVARFSVTQPLTR